MTRIKICGLTTPDSVRTVAAAGVDLIGFNFWPQSKRYVTPQRASELARELPDHIQRVGLFVDQPPDDIEAAIGALRLDWLQFHGDESPAACRRYGHPFFKAFRLRDERSAARIGDYLDADDSLYLVDAWDPAAVGGSGTPVRLDLALTARDARRPFRGRMILAGGLDSDRVGEAVARLGPYAVDVASGVESAPGQKDPVRAAAFCHAVRAAS